MKRGSGHQPPGAAIHGIPYPFIQPLLVVIPDKDLYTVQSMTHHGRVHMVAQELLFLFRCKNTRVPGLYRLGLVLQRDAFHIKPPLLKLTDIAAEIP